MREGSLVIISVDRVLGRKEDVNFIWGWVVRSMSVINWFFGFFFWERVEVLWVGEFEEGEKVVREICVFFVYYLKFNIFYKEGI